MKRNYFLEEARFHFSFLGVMGYKEVFSKNTAISWQRNDIEVIVSGEEGYLSALFIKDDQSVSLSSALKASKLDVHPFDQLEELASLIGKCQLILLGHPRTWARAIELETDRSAHNTVRDLRLSLHLLIRQRDWEGIVDTCNQLVEMGIELDDHESRIIKLASSYLRAQSVRSRETRGFPSRTGLPA